MSVRTTGADFKRFYADDEYWSDVAYCEGDELIIDGVRVDDYDAEEIADDAAVTIVCGIVMHNGNYVPMEKFFRTWRKRQTVTRFAVECDKSIYEAVKAAVESAGGKCV